MVHRECNEISCLSFADIIIFRNCDISGMLYVLGLANWGMLVLRKENPRCEER
jgi:hypothetical protein